MRQADCNECYSSFRSSVWKWHTRMARVCPQTGLRGIALQGDLFLQIVVPENRCSWDSLLQRFQCIMNVVSKCNDFARGICQKLLLASSFENTVAPVNCANVTSTLCSGCTSHSTSMLSLRCLRWTHMWTLLFFLGTTTIPARHGVGYSMWCPRTPFTPALVLSVHRGSTEVCSFAVCR